MKSIALTPALAQLAHTGHKTLTCRPGDGPAPYAVGDVCYIRETWQVCDPLPGVTPRQMPDHGITQRDVVYLGAGQPAPKWRPNIHMPAWAARTVVRVTEVERVALDALTRADVLAGGVVCTKTFADPVYRLAGAGAYWSSATLAYGHALQAIYTPARVATVWRIRFERVTTP